MRHESDEGNHPRIKMAESPMANKPVELTACSLPVYRKMPCRLETHHGRSSLPRSVDKPQNDMITLQLKKFTEG